MTPLAQSLRRSGTALAAGIDARTVWRREAEIGQGHQREKMDEVRKRIAKGDTVAESFSAADGYFPNLVCQMLEVGEKTGKLEDVLLRLAKHYDQLVRLRRNFITGIMWPAIQLGAALFVVGLLILIMGMIAEFTGSKVDLLGLGLVGKSGLVKYIAFLSVMALGLFFVVRSINRGGSWTRPLVEFATHLPVLGPALKTIGLARMAWTLSLAVESGLNPRESMRVSLRSTQNPYFSSHQQKIDRMLASGNEMYDALVATTAFPREFTDAVTVGEQTGKLDESMERLSALYQERAESAMSTMTTVATFAVWGAVATLIVILILRIAMFYVGVIYDAVGL